jgi:lipid-binding SYLF domain-containing protein
VVRLSATVAAAPDKAVSESLWNDAKCVAVIPSVTKAAFIVGGEYGKGVVSCRLGDGWTRATSSGECRRL